MEFQLGCGFKIERRGESRLWVRIESWDIHTLNPGPLVANPIREMEKGSLHNEYSGGCDPVWRKGAIEVEARVSQEGPCRLFVEADMAGSNLETVSRRPYKRSHPNSSTTPNEYLLPKTRGTLAIVLEKGLS